MLVDVVRLSKAGAREAAHDLFDAHLPLLLGEDGRKLSKSDAALPVDADDPLATLRLLWRCLGQAPLPAQADIGLDAFLAHAIERFRLEQVPRRALPASAAVHNTPATTRV